MIDTAGLRPDMFPSLVALRQAHADLLQRYRSDPAGTPLDDIEALVAAATATGVMLDGDAERWEAQGIIDYWLAVLYRARREPALVALQPFDPGRSPELPDHLCPYRGLEAFREAQHGLFFGRDRVVREMLKRLATGRLIAIVGPSGSGKSSLALAGLMPALRAGSVAAEGSTPASDAWRYDAPVVPGIHPLVSLAALLLPDEAAPADRQREAASLAADPQRLVGQLDLHDAPSVVMVDQFEELFTLCTDAAERRGFVDNLLAVAQGGRHAHRVVLTMRSDFDVQVASIPALQNVFDSVQYRIPAFNAAELRDAIEKPAKLVGLKFEDGIVDRLVNQILGEPAGLPLLQFALLKLWERRERNRVTLRTYQEVGGPMKALERSAEELHERLLPEEQVTARRILMRIVRPGNSLEVTSNRVLRESVHGSEPHERVDRVLDKLIAAGLLRQTGGPAASEIQIEVAHEALLRNWPRLVGWLEDERVRLRRRFSLTAAAQQWAAHGKDPGGLLGGSLLEEAQTYDDLDATEREFVGESKAALAAERSQREWRLRVLAVLLVILVGLAVGLGWTVWKLQVALENVKAEKRSTDVALEELQIKDQQRKLAAQAADEVSQRAARALDTAAKAVDEAARVAQAGAGQAANEMKLQTAKRVIQATKANIGSPVSAEIRPDVAQQAARPAPSAAPPEGAGSSTVPGLLEGIQIRASSTNTGRLLPNSTLPLYDFKIWLEGAPDALGRVRRVQYEFDHPTFRDKVQQSTDRSNRFTRGYAGWGCLSAVKVTVFAVDSKVPSESVTFDMCAAVQYQYRK
jgi:energy-coupling factor transporter ATP-binding protein EcfA2